MSAESSVSGFTGSGGNHSVVHYDYSEKKTDSVKVPKFNGDPKEFSWWKTNFYSYIMGLDDLVLHQKQLHLELLMWV